MAAMLAHQQTLQDIGHTLLAKRLERGLTLEDVASSINVRMFFLSCMEEGHFEKLPGGIYTVGLARLYMVWLGFEERQCQEWINCLQHHPIEDEKKLLSAEKPISKISLPVWASLGAIVLLVFLLWVSRGEKKEAEPAAFIAEQTSTSSEVAEESESNQANIVAILALYARGTTWIKITDADNHILHTQLVKKGTTVDLTPFMGKNLTVGDGRQVVIYHEGTEVGPLSEPSADDTPVLVENTPIRVEK